MESRAARKQLTASAVKPIMPAAKWVIPVELTLPPRARIVAGAREEVTTFLARYGAP
jgi:hypothetical protein